MFEELKVGGKHGVLEIEEIYNPNDYYKMIRGKNPGGQTRQLVTRGPGKNLAATWIPIVPQYNTAKMMAKVMAENQIPSNQGLEVIRRVLESRSRRDNLQDLSEWTVDLLFMPREGNLDDGMEFDAPGGTGEIGENANEVACREFEEDTGVLPICTWSPFPPGQFASRIYDEVQNISFAFLQNSPDILTEGAQAWQHFMLLDLELDALENGVYIDLKVTMAVMYLVERLLRII